MCDISHEENKAIKSQLTINHIPLNQDVLGIIKSFVFEDKKIYIQKKMQKERKDDLMQIILSICYDLREYTVEGNRFGHWAIWLPPPQYEDDSLQLQASNCLKCGKYVQVSRMELESAIIDNRYLACLNGQH